MNNIHIDDTDYLDFQKAFDKISYQRILKKLRKLKIRQQSCIYK